MFFVQPMDTAAIPALPDYEEEGLGGSCDFSFSQYPPVQLPLDPTRHVKQPLKGFEAVFYLVITSQSLSFAVNKSAKPSATAVKPDQHRQTSHVPTAAELFSSPVCLFILCVNLLMDATV